MFFGFLNRVDSIMKCDGENRERSGLEVRGVEIRDVIIDMLG